MEATTREARLAALPKLSEINREIAAFQHADTRRAIWQLANTLIPYVLLWYLMYRSLAVSYALTLGLAVLAAGFLVRVFIFFHDCGHNSFFPSTASIAPWVFGWGFWFLPLVSSGGIPMPFIMRPAAIWTNGGWAM